MARFDVVNYKAVPVTAQLVNDMNNSCFEQAVASVGYPFLRRAPSKITSGATNHGTMPLPGAPIAQPSAPLPSL